MESVIVIKGATLKDKRVDITIHGNRIVAIAPYGAGFSESERASSSSEPCSFDCEEATDRLSCKVETLSEPDPQVELIDGDGMAVMPPFYNTHTHAAMTLLRGYGDDLPLKRWLEELIWPAEALLTEDDLRAGVRLAIVEMIKSGTLFFNDMYWKMDVMPEIVEEMGIRAALGSTFTDSMSEEDRERAEAFIRGWSGNSERISLTVAPHAIYSNSEESLLRCGELARSRGMKLHIHVSETRKEVEDSLSQHGMTPIAYLDRLGLLGRDTIVAHAIHISDDDLKILASREVVISHCPCSNMKLSSGIFPMRRALEAGCRVTLGTDGCSSNNNLDMREEMKFAALLAKVADTPSTLPAEEIMQIATRNGAEAFGIDGGRVEVGALADLLLVRMDQCEMTPSHNPISNWVYSANSSAIDYAICNGRILMRNRHIAGEEEIIKEARERGNLIGRR